MIIHTINTPYIKAVYKAYKRSCFIEVSNEFMTMGIVTGHIEEIVNADATKSKFNFNLFSLVRS